MEKHLGLCSDSVYESDEFVPNLAFVPNIAVSAPHKTLTFIFETGRLPSLPDPSNLGNGLSISIRFRVGVGLGVKVIVRFKLRVMVIVRVRVSVRVGVMKW